MTKCSLLLLCAVLVACNGYYDIVETKVGEDLDGDEIVDGLDPCVAGYTDQNGDFDRDEIINIDDPCPLDPANDMDVDADADGVPDICDPDPAVAGDRLRCPMMFSNPDLDYLMWHTREGRKPWGLDRSGLMADEEGEIAGIATQVRIEAPGRTTFDVLGGVYYNGTTTGISSFRTYVRAFEAPADTDLGCEIKTPDIGMTFTLGLLGAPAQPQVMFASYVGDFRMVITFDASGDIQCVIKQPSGKELGRVAATRMSVPTGHVTFESDQYGYVEAVVVYER